MLRTAFDTIAVAPPLIAEDKHIDEIIDKLGRLIRDVA